MEGVKIAAAENITEITFWNKWYDWSVSGVDFNYEGNGGIECRDHVSFNRRVNETLLGMGVPSLAYILYLIYSTFATTSRPQKQTYLPQHRTQYSPLRMLLLVSLSFCFGIEVGYKFASKQLVWLLNPCHVTSLIQMYLLAAPSELWSGNQTIFKIMLHTLHGPLAALLFPVTDCLIMPFEVEIYYIQHYIIILVPLYLLLVEDGHGYQSHSSFDLNWYLKSYWVWSLWHWVVMMWTGYFTLANVGSMLCPAASDPFAGPDFRLAGIIHQSLSVAIFGTLAALLGETRAWLKPSPLQTLDSKMD